MPAPHEYSDSESAKYSRSLEVKKIARKKDHNKNKRIKVGEKITYTPSPVNEQQAFERLQKLTGQEWFEGLKRDFLDEFKHGGINIDLINRKLKPINSFIASLGSYDIDEASYRTNKTDTSNIHEYEYLRIKNRMYFKGKYEYNNYSSDMVYGRYFLFKEWLEGELIKLQDQKPFVQEGNVVSTKREILQKNVRPLISYFIKNEDILIANLKDQFSNYRGKKIRILIDVLIKHGLLKIENGSFLNFYNHLKEYFGQDIGSYQSINDFKESTSKAHKKDYDIIESKVAKILNPRVNH